MSIGTIAGILAGIGLFIGAIFIATDNFFMFVDAPSFIMVVGGACAASFISFEARYVILAYKSLIIIYSAPAISRNVLKAEVGRIIKWAYAVQKNGPAGLESETKKLQKSDKLLAFGVDCVLAGYSAGEVREILSTSIESAFGRNMAPVKVLQMLGGACPAFGMIGTLVGLVIMLGNLDDPSSLGPALSVALITTLYGVLFSRLIFMPAALKVEQREQIVRFRNYLVLEGLTLLADKKSPRYIQDRMNSYLDPTLHFNIDKDKSK
ncbi:MAG: flagellar motor protein MotA [Rhodospirillaceae bacterium]|jgi:chemotaxis protein MotA|nr:flagellar motor protein MotA [Rhodospirillaceae bacterium]|tara:strand:+ start:532 stop:1326 length:795 start_codon:yes stop_codon:yes gene_type:complete